MLTQHYGSAGMLDADTEDVVYPNAAENYALKLEYNRKHVLTRITRGPGFTVADFTTLTARIKQDLVASAGSAVCRSILFSSGYPVTGWWRYRVIILIGLRCQQDELSG